MFNRFIRAAATAGTHVSEIVILIAMSLVTLSIGIIVNLGVSTINPFSSPSDQLGDQTLEQRISILSTNLNHASTAISEIEAEIEERRNLVTKLEEQRQTAETISTLSTEQVEAVAQLFKGEVESSNHRSFWLNFWVTVGVNAAFFFIGFLYLRTYRWIVTLIRKIANTA